MELSKAICHSSQSVFVTTGIICPNLKLYVAINTTFTVPTKSYVFSVSFLSSSFRSDREKYVISSGMII